MFIRRVLVAMVVMFLFVVCTRNLSGPTVVPSHRGYNLYITFQNSFIIVYDTETNTFVDSLGGFPKYPWDIDATKSGKKLYICCRENQNSPPCVYSVDTDTRTRKVIGDHSAFIYISPGGTPFIVAESAGPYQHVGKIDTLSDTITWIDTLDIMSGSNCYQGLAFAPHEPVFYCFNNDYRVFKYNYETGQVLKTFKSIGPPFYHILMDSTGDYLYCSGGPVIDVELDSITGYIGAIATNYSGSLALGPNGDFLCATDPGRGLRLEPLPTGKVTIFRDLSKGTWEQVTYIDVRWPTISQIGESGWLTDKIVITNDGEKAFVSNMDDLIFILDLENFTVSDIIQLKWRGPIALALVPK